MEMMKMMVLINLFTYLCGCVCLLFFIKNVKNVYIDIFVDYAIGKLSLT